MNRWTPDEYRQKPKEFDPLLAETLIDRVANGETLSEVCRDRDMPLPATFLRWCARDPHTAEQYDEALRIRTELCVDSMLYVANDDDARRGRNKLDARRFHAERMLPEKYGPRAYLALGQKEELGGGVDWGADVRRKLEAMAKRLDEARVEPGVAG